MRYRACFRFEDEYARAIYMSVCQEAGEVGGRSSAQVMMDGEQTLVLEVSAADASALRAALNTWLRLISVAAEMRELVAPVEMPSRPTCSGE
jgi:KEOPS complex subunit Pcc1